MNPKNKLAEMPIRPLLYTMAVPLMLSLLIQSLYNIVDSIFVARLSETALTAASLVYAIQFLMIAIGVGTAVGLNALLSRKLGQKKPEEACRAATTGLFLMLGTSLVFTLVELLFSNRIAAALTNDPELQQLCREYLSVNLVQQGVPRRKCSVSLCWGYDEPVSLAIRFADIVPLCDLLADARFCSSGRNYVKLTQFLLVRSKQGLGQAHPNKITSKLARVADVKSRWSTGFSKIKNLWPRGCGIYIIRKLVFMNVPPFNDV